MSSSIIAILNKMGACFCEHALAMLIQSSILILVLLVIDSLLRKRIRAVFRYCIWLLVFVKLVLPPTLSLPTGIGYWCRDYWPANPTSMEVPSLPPVEYTEGPLTGYSVMPSEPPWVQPVEASVGPPAPAISVVVPASPSVSREAGIFLGWVVGVLVLAVLLMQRAWFVRGLIAQSQPAEGKLTDMLSDCCRELGIRKKIGLRISQNAQSPAACGLFKPKVLLPSSLLAHLSSDKLRTALLHELAHVKRGDLWVNFGQTVLQIIYFYNPLLWLANAMVRKVREQAVDEMVLAHLGDEAKNYSSTLVDIAEIAFARPTLGLRLIGVVESKKALAGRIKHILSKPFPKSAKLGALGLLTIIVTASILLPMAKGKWEKDIRNPVSLDENGKPIVTHTLYMQGQPEEPVYRLEGKTYSDVEHVVAHIGELMKQKPFPYIRVYTTSQFQRQQQPIEQLGKLCREIGFINMEFKYDLEYSNGEFKVTLPNGVTVELVGVCEHPSEGKQWWRPDGTPFTLPAGIKIEDRISRVGDNAYQFLFSYNSQEDLMWNSLDAVCLHFSIEGDSGVNLINLRRLPKGGQDGLVAKVAIFKEPLDSTTIQANLATGNWQTQAVRDISKIDQRNEDFYWFTSQSAGSTSLDILHRIVGQQIKTIAIDKEGNEYNASYALGSFGGWMPVSGIIEGTQKDERRYLAGLRKDDRLVKFKLQSRPFWSSVIGNVSLKPNFKTDVQVAYRTTVTRRVRQAGKPESGRDETYEFLTEVNRKTRLLTGKESAEMDNWISVVASVVKDNGRYLLPEDEELTLSELIRAAGYAPQKISVSFLEITRPVKLGQIKAYSIYSRNLETLFSGKESDPVLKRHDGIVGGWVYPSPNQTEFLARYSFGDVVELTVNDDNCENNMFVDLDTGKVLTSDEDLDKKDLEKVLKWMSDNGIDAVCNTSSKVRGLIGFGMVALSVDNYFWNADIPDFWDRLFTSIDEPVLLSAKKDLPATYLIQTNQHKMGILQILGFTDKPDGVRVRYKLLEKGEIENADVEVEVGTTNEADEVRYEGRTIDEWMAQWDTRVSDDIDAATNALIKIGRPAVPRMVEEVKKRTNHGWHAVGVLAKMGPAAEDALELLIATALDKDLRFGDGRQSPAAYRGTVLHSLSKMTWAKDRVTPVLQRIAQDGEEDPDVRASAIWALTNIPKEAMPILEKLTEAEDRRIRDSARSALAEVMDKEDQLTKSDYYTQLIEKDPFDPSVPGYLGSSKGIINLGRPHPLTQKIKKLYRQRLATEPDPELAWRLATIIQNGLRNTDLEWAAPMGDSTAQWNREDPAESYATLAEVLELGFRHAQADSQLWRDFGIALAKLRLLQGDWHLMNAILKELGQEQIPKESRSWLHAPPVDWQEGLRSQWKIADESMRSGNCSLEFRIEKDGKGLKGVHFLVKRAPEPTNVTSTGISSDTLFFAPYPPVRDSFGSFGYGGKDRSMTRYAVSDETGIVRFDKLPDIPVKVEVLVPTSNFPESVSNWDLWMEVEPGKFKIAKIYGGADAVGAGWPPAPEELKQGQTVHYPKLAVRPAFGFGVGDWTRVDKDNFVLSWAPMDSATRAKTARCELEMFLSAPPDSADRVTHAPVLQSAKTIVEGNRWPVGEKGVGKLRLEPGNIYVFEIRALDASGVVIARWPRTRVWTPWDHRTSDPPYASVPIFVRGDLSNMPPIHNRVWHDGSFNVGTRRKDRLRERVARFLSDSPNAFEYEYVRMGKAWLDWPDDHQLARQQSEQLVKELPEGNVARGTALWIIEQIDQSKEPPKRLIFVPDED